MAIEPAEKRRQQSRLIAAIGRSDHGLYGLRWPWLQVDRAFVADVSPSCGVAFSRPRARESTASAPTDLRLFFDHGIVKVGTITGDYLKHFHGLPLDSLPPASIARQAALVEAHPDLLRRYGRRSTVSACPLTAPLPRSFSESQLDRQDYPQSKRRSDQAEPE